MRRLACVVLLAVVPAFAGSGALAIGRAALEFPEAAIVATSRPDVAVPARYSRLVAGSAQAAGVPAWILARLLEAESSWSPDAVGVNDDGSRDLGIAQLGERWMDDFVWFDNGGAAFNPLDPEQAIPVAARYLARLHRASDDWRVAVAAYNCGLKRAKAGRLPAKTAAYVARIFGDSIYE